MINKILEVKDWISLKIDEQWKRELYEEPVFFLEELVSKIKYIQNEFDKIRYIKRPKVANTITSTIYNHPL